MMTIRWLNRLAFLGMLVCASGIVYGQNGVSLVRNFYQPHGQSADNPPIRFSGCWGYVAPDGREYAIVGTYTGTAIIDITDSATVREVAHITGPTSIWREMRTWGSYAYVVTEGGGGTQIIDLSQLPDTARLVTSFIYTSGSSNTSRSHTIEIFDGYMYLNGCANWPPGGVLIFGLSNPLSPSFIGQYQPPGSTNSQRYVHDSYVRNDTIFAASINSGGGINIADVTNKAFPIHIDKISYSGSGTHNVWTTTDGRYVISTDEIGTTQKNLKFWDISNFPPPPTSPAATYTYNPNDIVHNVTVRGNYAYVAWYTAGLVVVNITNPTSPQTAGWYDTYPGSSGSYNGVWAVYPYFPSGKIIVSDMQTGLYIFRFTGLVPRRPVQLLSPVDTDTVRVSSSILFRWTLAANKLQDPHYYELLINGPAINSRTRTDDTTYRLLSLAGFQPGGTYQWHVLTRDEVTSLPSIDTFRFVYLPPPSAPVLLSPPNHTTGQPLILSLSWESSPGASYYRIQLAVDSLFAAPVVDSLLASTTLTIGPLSGGTRYFWRVRASNTSGVSPYSSAWEFWTGIVPSAPLLVNPANGASGIGDSVTLLWRQSSGAISYRVQVATDSLFASLLRDTSGLADTLHQLASLPNVTLFYWHVRAQNAIGSGPWSERWKFVTGYSQPSQYAVTGGWNMLSLPLMVTDPRTVVLYPTSISNAFRFQQGYVTSDTIENGRGYWLKFGSSQTITITGVPIVRDTIVVVSNWNLIGTITVPVPVSSIVQIPSGVVQSQFYGFAAGYVPVDTLLPGKAYWVKANGPGSLVLSISGDGSHAVTKSPTVELIDGKNR